MKFGKGVLAISAIVVLVSCGDKFEEAKFAAASELIDPDSAKFREVKLHGEYVCGQINGKNGFGAYSGYTNFYSYEEEGEWIAQIFQRDEDQALYVESCVEKTIEQLEVEIQKGGEGAEIAKMELDVRMQDSFKMPEKCLTSWEALPEQHRNATFDVDIDEDRGFSYWDDKIARNDSGVFFFIDNTTIRFETPNGEQKLKCDPKGETAVLTLEDGSEIKMVSVFSDHYVSQYSSKVPKGQSIDPETHYTRDGTDSDGLPYEAGDPLPE